jgi:hypothetical protein
MDSKKGVKVRGKITDINLGCVIDRPTCSIFVDDVHEIIFGYGYLVDANGNEVEHGEMGQMIKMDNIAVNGRSLVGKMVEAYVAPVHLAGKKAAAPGGPASNLSDHNVYTLAGNKKFYIRLID